MLLLLFHVQEHMYVHTIISKLSSTLLNLTDLIDPWKKTFKSLSNVILCKALRNPFTFVVWVALKKQCQKVTEWS